MPINGIENDLIHVDGGDGSAEQDCEDEEYNNSHYKHQNCKVIYKNDSDQIRKRFDETETRYKKPKFTKTIKSLTDLEIISKY